MTTKSFATELKDLIHDIKDKQGISEIKCDNLIAYLDEVIKSHGTEITPAQMEEYKAKLQLWIKQNESVHAGNLEMFRAVIHAGQNALKTAFLMNGGATVALLAFLGKLSDQHQDKIAVFSYSLLVFVFGVLAITVASGTTYLSQWFYGQANQKDIRFGHIFNIVTILLSIISYALFISGTLIAYRAFNNFT